MRGSRPRRWRTLAAVLLAALAVPLVAWAVFAALATRAVERADTEAAARLGSALAAARVLPDDEGNDAALVLDELVARLLSGDPGAGPPDDERAAPPSIVAFDAVQADLARWLDAELAREDVALTLPPVSVEAFLDAQAPTLDAIVLHLLTGAAPRWPAEPRLGRHGPLPPSHRDAHDLLLAGALERARAGHPAAALAVLDAAWRLDEALLARHERQAQWVGLGALRRQLAVLRRIPLSFGNWVERLDATHPRASVVASLEWEAWCARHAAASGEAEFLAGWKSPVPGWPASLAQRIDPPFLRLVAADVALTLGRAAAAAADRDACAQSRPPPPPGWNPLAADAAVAAERLLALADAAERELDLARQVLLAKRAIAEGSAVLDSPAVEPCRSRKWSVRREEDEGTLSVELTVELKGARPRLASGVPRLPLAHRESLAFDALAGDEPDGAATDGAGDGAAEDP